MKVLNYDLIPHLHELRSDGRLALLLVLIMRSNIRNRCYPSMDKIAADIGWSLPSVTKAKEWLLEVGAIQLVDFKDRIDGEKDLPIRQHVYQITGYMTINGEKIAYLYMPELSQEGNTKASEISVAKTSLTLGKLNTSNNLVKEETKELTTKVVNEANAYPDANAQDVPLPFQSLTEIPSGNTSTDNEIATTTRKKEKTDRPRRAINQDVTPLDFREALAQLCGMDYSLNREKVNPVAKALYKANYRNEHLEAFKKWWLTCWKSKNGQKPRLSDVTLHILEVKEGMPSSEPFATSETVYGSHAPVNLNDLED